MQVNEKRNTAIGAGIGTIAGAGAGVIKGNKKAAEVLGRIGANTKTTLDEYVKTKVDSNLNRLDFSGTPSQNKRLINKTVEKVTESATDTFKKVAKEAKTTKVKWIAGLTAAGLAVGATVGFVASKIGSKKD